MHRIPIFLLYLALSFFISCTSGQKGSKSGPGSGHQARPAQTLHTTVTGDEEDVLEGKVVLYKGNDTVYFEQNWESRSKISLKVTGCQTDTMRKFNGRIVWVKGTVLKDSLWSGTVEITSILSNQ